MHQSINCHRCNGSVCFYLRHRRNTLQRKTSTIITFLWLKIGILPEKNDCQYPTPTCLNICLLWKCLSLHNHYFNTLDNSWRTSCLRYMESRDVLQHIMDGHTHQWMYWWIYGCINIPKAIQMDVWLDKYTTDTNHTCLISPKALLLTCKKFSLFKLTSYI